MGEAVAFISPSGFKIEVIGKSNVIRLLTRLASAFNDRSEIVIPDGSRIFIQDDSIILNDCDPWNNTDFNNGDNLGKVAGLAKAIGHYLLEQAWAKKQL
jgi:hypothetical protein